MVLVFILCIIVILITLFICMIILSTIRIKVDHFMATNIKENKELPSQKYKITISLYLFNKIKWFSIQLNDKKIRNVYHKMKLEKMDFKKIEQNVKWEDIKEMKKLNPEISYLNLEAKIGTEDAILTSFLIFSISTLISIILPHTIKKYEKNKYYYIIMPLYGNKNVYEIKFNCIIQIKMVHIINIVYVFLKKRRVDNNERTSNRRSYGYSYE